MSHHRPDLNYVQVWHGSPCPRSARCRLALGDLLIETWNRGLASVDTEWTVSKGRVDNPNDHAGSCTRLGPDVTGETRYPERP